MKENESLCAHNVLHKHLHAQSKATATFSPAPKQTFVLLEQLDKIRIPSVCACVTSSMRVCLLISIPLGKRSPAICSDSIFYNQSTLHKIGSDFCQGPSWFLAVNKNFDLAKKTATNNERKLPDVPGGAFSTFYQTWRAVHSPGALAEPSWMTENPPTCCSCFTSLL